MVLALVVTQPRLWKSGGFSGIMAQLLALLSAFQTLDRRHLERRAPPCTEDQLCKCPDTEAEKIPHKKRYQKQAEERREREREREGEGEGQERGKTGEGRAGRRGRSEVRGEGMVA